MNITPTQKKALENGHIDHDDDGNVVRFSPIGARSSTVSALLAKGYLSITKTNGYFSSHTTRCNFGRNYKSLDVWIEEPVYTITARGMMILELA
tara:strand:+ start:74 stop:355 length:282 start_codon:yes stop_codon:yes gene_type:complete